MKLTNKDYIFCEDCQMFVDFWKYDHKRYVTDEELAICIEDCQQNGCFERG